MDNYADYTFDAFISYSHRDLSWGNWLQRKLETFRIPKGLTPDRPGDKKLRVFRDQTDLTGTELQDSLRQNLRESRYLIVICSPASAASSWVNEEVLYFASLGRRDKIIPFIVDGEPNSDEPEMECFPQGLREIEDFTPLGANVREIGKDKAYLKTVSALLNIRFNRLVDREKPRRRGLNAPGPGALKMTEEVKGKEQGGDIHGESKSVLLRPPERGSGEQSGSAAL